MNVRRAVELLSKEGYVVDLYRDDLLSMVVESYVPEFDDELYGDYIVTSIEFAYDIATVHCSKYEKNNGG